MVRPSGIEPPHMAPEANALSTELRAHHNSKIISYLIFDYKHKLYLKSCIIPIFRVKFSYITESKYILAQEASLEKNKYKHTRYR